MIANLIHTSFPYIYKGVYVDCAHKPRIKIIHIGVYTTYILKINYKVYTKKHTYTTKQTQDIHPQKKKKYIYEIYKMYPKVHTQTVHKRCIHKLYTKGA